jgi:hypothetical protein
MTVCCDLISIEDVHNENLKVEETREVNEESIPVPTTNYFVLIFFGGLP